ncbi:MAG TPA: hypothetical protein VG944_10430 [Fimbriimonas sp.]|nr:hypothetical protein [Fimbriimonas sp.]
MYPLQVPDGFETTDMIGMGVAGALAKQYSDEQRDFLPLIAGVLKSSLPNEVELVEKGLFKKTLVGVSVNHGENRLKLEDTGRGSLEASFTRVVRGIALKTEIVTVQEWLVLVAEAIEDAVKNNASARAALAQTLNLP